MAAILDLVNFHRFKELEKMQSFFFLITTMFQMGIIVWCGVSEICLKLKVLAKIDFIVFLTLLGVK